MGVSDIFRHSPELVILWILALLLLLLMLICYLIQGANLKKPGNQESTRNLGNAIGGIGIVLCIVGAVFILLMIRLLRDVRNINADPSTILVSRSNLLLNWVTTADGLGVPRGHAISGDAPTDGTAGCFKGFQTANDPTAYEGYKAFIKAYEAHSGTTTKQYYEGPDGIYSAEDDLLNQQKLSLAYYRFVYCTKTYYEDILNRRGIMEMPFLSATAKANLQAEPRKSSCDATSKIPDTQACMEGGSTQTCQPLNPCWVALNETIAAQCLLYDDHVYNRINSNVNPRGVLEAMEIQGSGGGGPIGFRVKPPTIKLNQSSGP